MRPKSSRSACRSSCVKSLRLAPSLLRPSSSRELTRVSASPGVGELLRIQVDVQADRAALVALKPASSPQSVPADRRGHPATSPVASVRAPRFYAGSISREAPHAAPAVRLARPNRSLSHVRVYTVDHGTRPGSRARRDGSPGRGQMLVGVRRFPSSRRHPQFNQAALAGELGEAGIACRHEVELGGRRSGEPGEERYACIRTAAARATPLGWGRRRGRKGSLQPWPGRRRASSVPRPCPGAAIASDRGAPRSARARVRPACSRPTRSQSHHRFSEDADWRDGQLFCGELVA